MRKLEKNADQKVIDEKKYGPNLGKNSDPNLENYGQPS